jgi:L,D-transpeptidase YcbB
VAFTILVDPETATTVCEKSTVLTSSLSRRQFISSAFIAPLAAASAARAQDASYTGSISSVAPRMATQGKLATHTEIVAGRGEAPILTLGSIDALSAAIDTYEEIAAGGGWPTLPNVKFDKKTPTKNLILLRQRLVREAYLDFETLSGSSANKMDATMVQAIKAFQFNHGTDPSGKVDARTLAELNIPASARLATLKENLTRVVEYSKDLGPRYIAMNIPSAQLESIELGQVYSRHNVVVGKFERPTPCLKSRVSDIVFNPPWNAPASIVAKDIIPKFLKDPNYLDQMKIHVFDGVGGPEIEPSSVDWENTPPDRFHFQQEPGEHNALATVKINFPNKFMVYMHDTPHRELFATNNRYESSGCCRVDRVRDLITWVMNGQDNYDENQFELITATEETYQTKVQTPPDVRFMYLTGWATEDGRVNFRPDVYKLDGNGFILGQPEPMIGL